MHPQNQLCEARYWSSSIPKRVTFYFVSSLLLFFFEADAANRYWVGTSGANWNTTTSWSTATGGANGASVPGSGDVAIFDGGGATNCTIDANVNVNGLQMNSGYTATISQNAYTVIIGTGGWNVTAGTFTGSSSSITLTGALTINGGTLTSTSGTLSTNSGITFSSGTFNHNNGTVTITATMTLSGSPTFYNLSFAPAATASTYTISNTPVVNNTLSLAGARKITLNTGTIDAQGNITITNTNTGGGGNGTINIVGTGTQTLTGSGTADAGILPNVTINKSSGTLNLSSTITFTGTWTYTAGTVSAGTSNLNASSTCSVDCQGTSATMALYTFTVYSGTTTLAGNMDLDNNMNINTSATLSGGTYSINIGGNWNNSGTWTYSTSTVEFDGSGYKQILITSGTETFYNLKANKSGGTILLSSPTQVNNQLTLTAGKIKSTSTNYLKLIAGSSYTGGSNSSYVAGPVRKTGNSAFIFPTGDSLAGSTPWHPVAMSAPATSTDEYEARYYATSQILGSAKASTIHQLSSCEYWTLERTAPASGTTSVSVTLNWNTNCNIVNYPDLIVSGWNGSQWDDLGASGLSITTPTGSLSPSASLSYTASGTKTLMLALKVTSDMSYTELARQNNGSYINSNGHILYFRYHEDYKDLSGTLTYRITRLSDNTQVTLLSNASTNNVPVVIGQNNYRMDLYDATNTPLAAGMYMLEITNEKNETVVLRFNKTN